MALSKYNEILNIVSKKHSLDISEVQNVFEKFFLVINQGLENDKSVKIKGLGTFKVVEVQDRESVNVNTGERMLISGHNKITFTPDSSMRDRVNRPFLQFDSVVLDDNVNMNFIDRVSEEETQRILDSISLDPFAEIDDKGRVVERIEVHNEESKERPVEDEKPKEVVIPETQVTESKSVKEISYPVFSETENPVKEDENDNAITLNKESSSPENKDIESFNDEIVSQEESNEVESNEVESNEVDSNDDDSDDYDSHSRCKLYAVLSCILFVLIAFGLGFMAGIYYSNLYINATETVKVKNVAKKSPANVDSIKSHKTENASVDVNNSLEKANEEAKAEPSDLKEKTEPTDSKPKTTEASDNNKMPDYNDMDVRIRTGAYSIVGLDYVIKVKPNETLKQISDRVLGPGMECYIEVFNGIKEVKEGQQIKIPKIILKKKLVKKS